MTLIKLAQHLDSLGEYENADIIDKIILAQAAVSLGEGFDIKEDHAVDFDHFPEVDSGFVGKIYGKEIVDREDYNLTLDPQSIYASFWIMPDGEIKHIDQHHGPSIAEAIKPILESHPEYEEKDAVADALYQIKYDYSNVYYWAGVEHGLIRVFISGNTAQFVGGGLPNSDQKFALQQFEGWIENKYNIDISWFYNDKVYTTSSWKGMWQLFNSFEGDITPDASRRLQKLQQFR
jgi:hypothetical protein